MINYITKDRNDQFSELSYEQRDVLLDQINSFYLTYRSDLQLPDELTFGIEIEAEKINFDKTYSYLIRKFPDWDIKDDISLVKGIEAASPILSDTKETWEEIRDICEYFRKIKAYTLGESGGHVHISARPLEKSLEYWRRFIKLYTAYESVLWRFSVGDKNHIREGAYDWAAPISDELRRNLAKINDVSFLKELRKLIPTKTKKQALNFRNARIFAKNKSQAYRCFDTIEDRKGNGTTNEIIWQNYVNTDAKLVLAATKSIIDEDFLDDRIEHYSCSLIEQGHRDFEDYSIGTALEFVDLIFDNNLDKVYFLRQYIRGYETTDCFEEPLAECEPFTL
jgi:hypothetical protein